MVDEKANLISRWDETLETENQERKDTCRPDSIKDKCYSKKAGALRNWRFYLWIDPKIRELLIFLHAKGFQTISSCQGHPESLGFYITFFVPSLDNLWELRKIYGALTKRVEKKLPQYRLNTLKFIEEWSTRGRLYVKIEVKNHSWTEEDYEILRKSFTEIVKRKMANVEEIMDRMKEIERKIKDALEKDSFLAGLIEKRSKE